MKRIVIITQGLSRIVEPLYNSDSCNIIGIVECAPRWNPKPKNHPIISLYHKLKKTENKLLTFSKLHKIPYFFMTKSNKALEKWLLNLQPDLIVVFMMSQLLSENIFSIPRFGTINIHPSILPKYRGPNPCFWSYYNMEPKGGVSIHFIDRGEDTGDIIYQGDCKIPLGIRSPDRLDLLINEIGIPLLIRAIKNIEVIVPLPQKSESPTIRARNLELSEHNKIINWESWPIERIWHILRGTELWLNAISKPKGIYLGTRWIIGDFEKKKLKDNWTLGHIYKKNKQYFVVCNEGVIYLRAKINIKTLIISLLKS